MRRQSTSKRRRPTTRVLRPWATSRRAASGSCARPGSGPDRRPSLAPAPPLSAASRSSSSSRLAAGDRAFRPELRLTRQRRADLADLRRTVAKATMLRLRTCMANRRPRRTVRTARRLPLLSRLCSSTSSSNPHTDTTPPPAHLRSRSRPTPMHLPTDMLRPSPSRRAMACRLRKAGTAARPPSHLMAPVRQPSVSRLLLERPTSAPRPLRR